MSNVSLLRRLAPAALLLAAGLGLTSCGTVSKSECQVGDWRAIGLRDGRDGRSELFFAKNAESCQRYGLPADQTAWAAGRLEGLKDYCTPLSGYAVGRSGRTYENVCTGKAGGDFVFALSLGSTVREAREEARRYEAEADRAESQLSDDEREILVLRTGIDGAPEADRPRMRARISELEFRRMSLLSDRFAAERAAARADAEADAVEADARARFLAAFGMLPG